MKIILVVDQEMPDLPDSKFIIRKRNKTIIKDLNLLNDANFISRLQASGVKYKYLLENWEVLTDNMVQLLCANDGSKIRAVHIVSDTKPYNGRKALFQSEKMLVLKLSGNMYDFSKYTINEQGAIFSVVLKVGSYQTYQDLLKELAQDFEPMITSLIKNHSQFRENYLAPIYCSL